MNDDLPHCGGYSMVLPFVVCTSEGGPYDDDSFVAGWNAAMINSDLVHHRLADTYQVRPVMLRQLDLLAMHHDHVVVVLQRDDEWAVIRFDPGVGII